MSSIWFRYADFGSQPMSEKVDFYLQKFREKFKLEPKKIRLNAVYEKDIGNKIGKISVEYLSTLNLNELDFCLPDGFMPSHSI